MEFCTGRAGVGDIKLGPNKHISNGELLVWLHKCGCSPKTSYPRHAFALLFNGKEGFPSLDKPLDQTVVLLYQVLQVFELPQFDLLGKDPSSLSTTMALKEKAFVTTLITLGVGLVIWGQPQQGLDPLHSGSDEHGDMNRQWSTVLSP